MSRCGVYVHIYRYASGIDIKRVHQLQMRSLGNGSTLGIILRNGVTTGIVETMKDDIGHLTKEHILYMAKEWTKGFVIKFTHFLRSMDVIANVEDFSHFAEYVKDEEQYCNFLGLLKLFCEAAIKADRLNSLVDEPEAKELLNVLHHLERNSV